MLKADFIDEVDVQLEFGEGRRHVDIRFGILNHGVLDGYERHDARKINIGIIGTAELMDGFLAWMQECNNGVEAKDTPKRNLFPRFPGFGAESPFKAEWECRTRAQRNLTGAAIARLGACNAPSDIVKEAVALYVVEVDYLVNEISPDVIFCVIPDELSEQLDRAAEMTPCPGTMRNDRSSYRLDFHHLLKAETMKFHTPIQLVLPSTFGFGTRGKATRKKRPGRSRTRRLQDPATRAWNLFTAMYYKAGGVPWRLPREASNYATCYVGVGFYKSLDDTAVMTSIAQLFNERGEGIVVRGGQAELSERDRTPHLNENDAANILVQALQRYRDEHKTLPARLVLHKSSYFTAEELNGFRIGIKQERLEMADMLSIRKSSVRLFRNGQYPVLRGTHLPMDGNRHLLYTRGSVPFFETYPGLYVPRALEIRMDATQQSRERLCREVLALTKMNWNSTEFDMRDPITLHAAKRVGDIMKYISADAPKDSIARRYSFYM